MTFSPKSKTGGNWQYLQESPVRRGVHLLFIGLGVLKKRCS
jgi:hypothetical protein